jgi:hypothetical protein
MKKILCFISIISMVACSAPKYTAGFHKSDVQVGYHPVTIHNALPEIQKEHLTASTSTTPVILPLVTETEVKTSFVSLTKGEQKNIRYQLKKQIKSLIKVQKKEMAVNSTQASGMDHDLKLAAIFGAVGIVGLLIGGQAFTIIGGTALIIGVVFFVKWLLRQ